jgi:hypothetical protein
MRNSSRVLARAYLSSILLFIALSFWIISGYPGLGNSNFIGGASRLSGIECLSSIDWECDGKPDLPTAKDVLLGDSEAVSISDLFKDEFGKNSYIGAYTGCAFLPPDIFRTTQTSECLSLNAKHLILIKEVGCKNIYIFNRFRPVTEYEEEQYLEFISSISRHCNSVTIIGTPSEMVSDFRAYSNLFFKSSLNTPKQFIESDFDSLSLKWNDKLRNIVPSLRNNMYYIDTNSLILPVFPTSLKNASGEYLYFDSTHLSRYGGELVVKELANIKERA